MEYSCCRFFPFITLNILCHSPLTCRVSAEKSADSLMGVPMYGTCCFSLAAFFFFKLYLFYFLFIFWLHRVLVAARGIFCCGAQALHCSVRASLQLQRTGSVVVARGLSCPAACGILVPRPGMEPVSPALQDGFSTTGPPEVVEVPPLLLLIFSL